MAQGLKVEQEAFFGMLLLKIALKSAFSVVNMIYWLPWYSRTKLLRLIHVTDSFKRLIYIESSK